jgi:hypothetical protein
LRLLTSAEQRKGRAQWGLISELHLWRCPRRRLVSEQAAAALPLAALAAGSLAHAADLPLLHRVLALLRGHGTLSRWTNDGAALNLRSAISRLKRHEPCRVGKGAKPRAHHLCMIALGNRGARFALRSLRA